jgi:hypothetical protein
MVDSTIGLGRPLSAADFHICGRVYSAEPHPFLIHFFEYLQCTGTTRTSNLGRGSIPNLTPWTQYYSFEIRNLGLPQWLSGYIELHRPHSPKKVQQYLIVLEKYLD